MSEAKAVKSSFAEVPGAKLFYELAGEGAPIIFLHGGFLDRRMWDEQFQFFAQHYQAIRYDVRRSGKSQDIPSTEPYIHYQDLYHLLLALDIKQASLVGLSGGARIAIDMAIAHPEMVQKLVTVSPGMSGYTFVDEWTHDRGQELQQAAIQRNVAGMVEIFTVMWTDGPYRTPEQMPPALRERIREMATHTVSRDILSLEMHELEPPALGRLAEIKAPTLIVLGDKDTSDIHAIGKLLHTQVATSKLSVIPDTGHTLVMEKPNEFNILVDQFLREAGENKHG